jgi:hypothetical protein
MALPGCGKSGSAPACGVSILGTLLTKLTNHPVLRSIFDMTELEIPNLFAVSAKSS